MIHAKLHSTIVLDAFGSTLSSYSSGKTLHLTTVYWEVETKFLYSKLLLQRPIVYQNVFKYFAEQIFPNWDFYRNHWLQSYLHATSNIWKIRNRQTYIFRTKLNVNPWIVGHLEDNGRELSRSMQMILWFHNHN